MIKTAADAPMNTINNRWYHWGVNLKGSAEERLGVTVHSRAIALLTIM